jgi:hypothetical protein
MCLEEKGSSQLKQWQQEEATVVERHRWIAV